MTTWGCGPGPEGCAEAAARAQAEQAAFNATYANFWTDPAVMQAWAHAYPMSAVMLTLGLFAAVGFGGIGYVQWRRHRIDPIIAPIKVPITYAGIAILCLWMPFLMGATRIPKLF